MKKIITGIFCSTVLLIMASGSIVQAEETFDEMENTNLVDIFNHNIQPDIDAKIISDEGESYLNAPVLNLSEDTSEYSSEDNINTRVIVAKWWKIESKTSAGVSYGGWRNGPSGKGAARLSATNSNTTNRSVTSSISGDVPIGKGKVGSSLGITIGESKQFGVSYSIDIPKNKRQQIIFRPVYKVTKVKQRYYVAGSKTNTVKTATVKSFSHWDYSKKTL